MSMPTSRDPTSAFLGVNTYECTSMGIIGMLLLLLLESCTVAGHLALCMCGAGLHGWCRRSPSSAQGCLLTCTVTTFAFICDQLFSCRQR